MACLSWGFSAIAVAQSAPIATVSTPVQFGTISLGSTLTQQIPVTNTGTGSLTISPSINGPSYTVAGTTPTGCLAGTPAGQTCTLNVQFNPVTVGPHDDNLTLQTNGASSPVVSLTGLATGIGTQIESAINFPAIPYGTSRVQPIIIKNFGVAGGALSISTTVHGPSFKVLNSANNTCVLGLSAGHTCILLVEFVPASVGSHGDILTVTSSAGTTSSIKLKGLALAEAAPVALPHGAIIVPDANDQRVQIFGNAGVYESGFNAIESSSSVATDGFSFYTAGCAIDKYDANNNWLLEFGTCVNQESAVALPGALSGGEGIAIAPNGNIWVTSTYSLQEFSPSGHFIKFLCTDGGNGQGPPDCPSVTPHPVSPDALAIDAAGDIYLINGAYDQAAESGPIIVKLSASGKYLATYRASTSAEQIAVAPNGNICVELENINSVEVLDKNGVFQFSFGGTGTGEGEFTSMGKLAVDADGNIYVTDADYLSYRVEEFDSNGVFLNQFGSYGDANGQFYGLYSLAVVQ